MIRLRPNGRRCDRNAGLFTPAKDTYFCRKFFYKTKSGARIVASIPFLETSQDTLDSNDIGLYPSFATVCALLDKLVSCR